MSVPRLNRFVPATGGRHPLAATRPGAVDEPDPDLVRAAAGGDLDAFEALVRQYQEPVWRFLRHLVRDPALAEDVAQETFLRVYRKLDTFAHQSRFSTWLFQIARNAGIDALRRRDRGARLVDVVSPPRPRPSPEGGVELEAGLSALSPKLREALLVVEVLGYRYREAAVLLGVPEGTVKSRVHQARERLVAWMDEDGEQEGRAAR
jgi:RNA polymerase sigma-70 factor, ECF subfamily